MAKMMIHPYYGDLVVCAELDGQQHDQAHQLAVEECELCAEAVLSCEDCHVAVSCCYCGAFHAIECPWPL